MKYLKSAGVLLMIVVFPAISWFYLNAGFQYRKEAFVNLQPKTVWDQAEYTGLGDFISYRGKTSVVFNTSVPMEFIQKFHDQYKDAFTFQTYYKGRQVNPLKNGYTNLTKLDSTLSFTPEVILIDTLGDVRNTYSSDQQSLTLLIEDTAIVLPRKAARDVRAKTQIK